MKHLMIATVMAAGVLASGWALAEDVAKPARAERMKQHMAKMFETIDTDKDGAVSEKEHVTFSTARFKEMDISGDGKVTIDEMQTHHQKKWAERAEKKAATPATDTKSKE